MVKVSRQWLISYALVLIGIVIRIRLLPFLADDVRYFFSYWYEMVRTYGFSAIGGDFYDHTPHFVTFLWLGSYLEPWLGPLTVIKLTSLVFDPILAAGVGTIVASFSDETDRAGVFFRAFAVTYLIPTVILNGSCWGQYDVLYSTMAIWAVAALVDPRIKRRALRSHFFFGLGLATKLQMIFFSPLYLVLYLRRKLNPVALLVIPVVYLTSMIPALFAGRTLKALVGIYLNQSTIFRALTMNAPNFYMWISNDYYDWVYPKGVIFAGLILLACAFLFAWRLKQVGIREILTMAAFFSWLSPFVLPKMHERYFYLAEVFSVALILVAPKGKRLLPVLTAALIQGTSLLTYARYLLHVEPVPFVVLPAFHLVVAILWIPTFYPFMKGTSVGIAHHEAIT